MPLTIDKTIGDLFHDLLEIPEGCQLFTNQFQITRSALNCFTGKGLKITGICTDPELELDLPRSKLAAEDDLKVLAHPDLALFNPTEKFHLGFSAFQFEINAELPEKDRVKPLLIKDRLQFFKCSEGKEEREVAFHILGLEQLLRATLAGGYFGAVLPKRWVGREMKYLRWWNDNAALVVQIKLPANAVTIDSSNAPGEWLLCIWNKPLPETSKLKQLSYARFRFSPFIFPLETLGRHDDCIRAFQGSEWYSMSIAHWHDAVAGLHSDDNWGTWRTKPLGVSDPKDIYFFAPKEEFKTGLRIVQDKGEIRQIKHAVHVKPGRVIKLSCYPDRTQGAANQSALLDLRCSLGTFTQDRSGSIIFNYDIELKYRPFMDIREQLLTNLEEQGLVPCMTVAEHHKMLKKERWLAIHLTPIERNIPATRAAAQVAAGSEQSGEEADWEVAYEDIGMKATFPDIMEMWRKRAIQMNLDRPDFNFEFQFEDLIYYAAKQNLANCSVMGLGKTRLSLFSALLRGARRTLIIVPAKLLGVWQDEIDNTIVPYCRFQKKDWQGRILDPSYQVVEWARDLYPANLKTFNLISYDRAKAVARDGKFYKCPRCGTVVYSAKVNGCGPPVCPGDSSVEADDPRRCDNLIKHWKKICAGPGYSGEPGERYAKRKFRVVANEQGEPILREDQSYHRVHYSKLVDHEGNQFPLERTTIIDERPRRPKLPHMEVQENFFKKVRRTLIGYDTNDQNGVKTPVYKNIERSPHLRWSLAHLLRNRFSHVCLDEALYIMNEDSQRSMAVNCINGRQRVINTGTPLKNMPQNILALFNWCFPRDIFPDYRPYDPGGLSRFLKKYSTEVYIGGLRLPDGQIVGGKPKQIPKVNNPELFQAEFAPMMLRHTRNEPKVLKDIPRKIVLEDHHSIEMDEAHRDYYKKWLDKFSEWWMKMKEEEEGRKVPPGQLLAKLGYLINASAIPHFMLDGIMEGEKEEAKEWAIEIGVYKGPPPSKMRRCWEMIKANVANNDKTIVAAWRIAALQLGMRWCEKSKIAALQIDGTVPNTILKTTGRSKKHELIEAFRHYGYQALWSGLEVLAEGFNIPEANHAILLDCGWAPSAPRQLIGRMIRPQQKKTIYANYLLHKGTIDEYMFALSYLKGRSSDEAIDYMEFDDFSTDIIPDIHQYADAIVDGREEKVKQAMWLAVDHLKRQIHEEGEDEA